MPFLLLMPSYNQGHSLREAIDSCLAQQDPDWELWILDNSDDGSPAIMKSFNDRRIHFIHEPYRMDPGTCLNVLLDQARGECFSYVHADNRLGPHYVGALRRALTGHRLGLAYCDHWVIGHDGRRIGLQRRPEYGSGTILGSDALGVPFAAKTELARTVGGFSPDDLADDVLFCDLAWGFGSFVHVRRPLMEYRLHQSSRTGGAEGGVLRAILKAHAHALPVLQRRQPDPLRAMDAQIEDLLLVFDGMAAETCYARLGSWPTAFGSGWGLESLWRAGVLRLPFLGPVNGCPRPRWFDLRAWNAERRMLPIKPMINATFRQFRSVVVGSAYLRLSSSGHEPERLGLRSLDLGTVWAARILERDLGWRVSIQPEAGSVPSWCRWPVLGGGVPFSLPLPAFS